MSAPIDEDKREGIHEGGAGHGWYDPSGATRVGAAPPGEGLTPYRCVVITYCLDYDRDRKRPRRVRCPHCYGKATADYADIDGLDGYEPPLPRLARWMVAFQDVLHAGELARSSHIIVRGPVVICKGDTFI